MMDPAKQAKMEKVGVLALGAVFVIVFLTGPAKTLGLFGPPRAAAPAPAQDTVAITQPLGDMLSQSRRASSDPSIEDVAEASVKRELTGEPLYTASALRNPFENQLPKPEPPASAQNLGPNPEDLEPEREPIEPPHLSVQGVIWGGPKPQAIINDLLYGMNDVVKGARIVSIDDEGVTVDYEGETFHYTISSDIR